ncbi:MAG: ABC transporter permease [Bacteroidota bacterium]
MLSNHLKVAYRLLHRQKGYAFINIFGLAVGLTCFILISLLIRFELGYDQFHEKADRIYRVAKDRPDLTVHGNSQWAVTPAPLAAALVQDLPDVEHVAQVTRANSLLERGNTRFHEEGLVATPHFFEVFSFPLLQGDPQTALRTPDSIVLTASLARTYFGETDPMGQTITVRHDGEHSTGLVEMRVTGVVEDVPAQSHLTFDYLVPVTSSNDLSHYLDAWYSNSYLTYVVLRPGHSPSAFADNLRALSETYLRSETQQPDEAPAGGIYFPQALTDIHLHSQLNGEFRTNGSLRYVYLLAAIAALILFIACINYVNLAVARALTRKREVGVRKVLGARRGQLVEQFMSEAILPSMAALLVALGLVSLLLPSFNALTGRALVLTLEEQGAFLGVLLALGLGVGVLAGTYPALAMASFRPLGLMHRRGPRRAGPVTVRNVLVLTQFAITTVLAMGALVIQQQLHYIQQSNTGLERDQVLSVEIKDQALHEQYAALKQTLEGHAQVVLVSAAAREPVRIDAATRATDWEGAVDGQEVLVHRSRIQHDFVSLFGLEVVEGRDLSETVATDADEGMLINETLKRRLGWETAVGKRFDFFGREARVTGVVKDFHFDSFHREIEPLALFLGSGWFAHQRLFIKVRPQEMPATLAFVAETMAQFSPEYPFEYRFLDEAYAQMYEAEVKQGRLFSVFTGLALLIACLGLVGLAAFATAQRRKEVGVRKVLGASVGRLMVLLTTQFLALVILAFVVAMPVAYLAAEQWLAGFAFRIRVGPELFLAAGGLVLTVAVLAVAYQAVRAATADPVQVLRYE